MPKMRRIGRNPIQDEPGDAGVCRNRARNTIGSVASRRVRLRRADTLQVFWVRIRYYSVPNLTHDVKIPPDVVPGGQCGVQNLPGLEQMAKVCSGVTCTSITPAVAVQGTVVVPI